LGSLALISFGIVILAICLTCKSYTHENELNDEIRNLNPMLIYTSMHSLSREQWRALELQSILLRAIPTSAPVSRRFAQ
jgi:hypothetical protein